MTKKSIQSVGVCHILMCSMERTSRSFGTSPGEKWRGKHLTQRWVGHYAAGAVRVSFQIQKMWAVSSCFFFFRFSERGRDRNDGMRSFLCNKPTSLPLVVRHELTRRYLNDSKSFGLPRWEDEGQEKHHPIITQHGQAMFWRWRIIVRADNPPPKHWPFLSNCPTLYYLILVSVHFLSIHQHWLCHTDICDSPAQWISSSDNKKTFSWGFFHVTYQSKRGSQWKLTRELSSLLNMQPATGAASLSAPPAPVASFPDGSAKTCF